MDPIPSGSGSNDLFLERMVLYDIMRKSGLKKLDDQFQYLKEHIAKRTNCPNGKLNELYKNISHFTARFKEKWIASERMETRFLSKNQDWLKTSLCFKVYNVISEKANRKGRPVVSFEDSSDRSKRLKTEDLRKRTSAAELAYATQMNLRASGHSVAAKLVEEITRSPEKALEYRQMSKALNDSHTKIMSGDEALSTLVEAKLTTHQYNIIRSKDPKRFPSFKVVQAAKKLCYPKKEDMTVTSTSVDVTLQALLDHTTERLITVQKDVIAGLENDQLNHMYLVSKWGFDGSSGHSSYKQPFVHINADDSSVFISSLVPIRLVVGDPNKNDATVVWQNPRPSSTRFCRPIKIQFVKETTDIAIAEKNRIEEQIENLRSTTVTLGGQVAVVTHNLCFTMVDGKICNSLTNTISTQRCYICGASSKQFNCVDKSAMRAYDTSNLQFGLSVLHTWIRCFECLLHVGYKLPIKKWQARKQDKEIVAQNKVRIQKAFRDKMGLIVDKPKPGFGNSNDGNTARRFFGNATVASEITDVDKNLIERLHVILVAISSGFDIHVEKFRTFTLDTAKLFVHLYPWFYMPPTMHKLLIHGPDIIANALLPIGQLSEEAQEARNKDFKKYREGYSRKCSREACNEDVFNCMLISSDPVITSYRQLPKKKLHRFPKEVFELIVCPVIPRIHSSYTEVETDGSSSASVSDNE